MYKCGGEINALGNISRRAASGKQYKARIVTATYRDGKALPGFQRIIILICVLRFEKYGLALDFDDIKRPLNTRFEGFGLRAWQLRPQGLVAAHCGLRLNKLLSI